MKCTPWVNYALIAANVIIYILGYNASNPENLIKINDYMLQAVNPQIHQFLTSVFLHADLYHLLGNMLFLWVFGNALNDRFGHVGYLMFYIAGGISADIGYLLWDASAPSLGASGAIAAVTGAYLVLLPRVRVTVLVFFYIITFFEISSLVFLMIQFIWNMFMTGTAAGGVAYSAHSAGYIFGIVTAVILLAVRALPRDDYDLLNLVQQVRRRGKYRRMVAQGYDPFSHQGSRSRSQANARRKVAARVIQDESPDSPAARELRIRHEISDACENHDLSRASAGYLQLVQIADKPVLPKQQQLDVANQLMSDDHHPAAADAYERFLEYYPNYEHLADIYLLLGLLYCRYLHQYDRAEQMLARAVEKLDDPRKIELAKSNLRKIRGKGRA